VFWGDAIINDVLLKSKRRYNYLYITFAIKMYEITCFKDLGFITRLRPLSLMLTATDVRCRSGGHTIKRHWTETAQNINVRHKAWSHGKDTGDRELSLALKHFSDCGKIEDLCNIS